MDDASESGAGGMTSIAGSGVSVSVVQPHIVTNSGPVSMAPSVVQSSNGKRVLITPLRAHHENLTRASIQQKQPRRETVIPKVLLKAVSKGKKSKTFTLRNINTADVKSCDSLKRVIKLQLPKEIIPDINEFDVGLVQGSNMVCIRSE